MVAVGFVGAGRMGMPVAARMAAAGHTVIVTDIRAEVESDVIAAGMKWGSTPAFVASTVDVLITMLPGPVECRTAMVGEIGALERLQPGATWIDLTSNSPAVGAELAAFAAARGIAVLESPVGGGPGAASAGTLTLFVAGDRPLMERHRPLLESISHDVRYVGAAGAGYATKLLVNQLWFGQAVATAEVMLLAGKLGLDLGALQRTLVGSAASSRFIENDLPLLMDGDYLLTFPIGRVVEELLAVRDLAAAKGTPFAVGDQVLKVHLNALARFGNVDGELAAVAFLEEAAGLLIRTGLEVAPPVPE